MKRDPILDCAISEDPKYAGPAVDRPEPRMSPAEWREWHARRAEGGASRGLRKAGIDIHKRELGA